MLIRREVGRCSAWCDDGYGIPEAQYEVLDLAWRRGDFESFVAGADVLADRLIQQHAPTLRQTEQESAYSMSISLEEPEGQLLLFYGEWLVYQSEIDVQKAQNVLTLSALSGDPRASYLLGRFYARLDIDGNRAFSHLGAANYMKAVVWLQRAAEKGEARAWHALSRIFAKSEFSRRNLQSSQEYLLRSAELGFVEAQYEYANVAWRNRRHESLNDVRALYWWLKAAQGGHKEAAAAAFDFSARPIIYQWAKISYESFTIGMKNLHP